MLSSSDCMRITFPASSPTSISSNCPVTIRLEQTNLTNLVEHLRPEVKEQEKQKVNVRQFLAAVRKYTDMQQLDAFVLREFVEKIYISEVYTPDENEPRIKVREIEIVYNFIGAFDFEEAREQSQAAQKEKKTGVA